MTAQVAIIIAGYVLASTAIIATFGALYKNREILEADDLFLPLGIICVSVFVVITGFATLVLASLLC